MGSAARRTDNDHVFTHIIINDNNKDYDCKTFTNIYIRQ